MDSRESNGKLLFEQGNVINHSDGTFGIKGKFYTVTETSCDCPDKLMKSRNSNCKHMFAVKYWLNANDTTPKVDNNVFIGLINYIEGMGGVVPDNNLYAHFTDELIELAVQQKKILKSGRNFVLMG